LKSLKVKVRAIASRPGVSVHPGKPFRADFRASSDSRSTMIAFLLLHAHLTLTPNDAFGVHATIERQSQSRVGCDGSEALVVHSRKVDHDQF
jgi:hypothetical protein